MRVAVISDIHANLPAFEAVLEAIDGSSAEEIWCLGDVVGYGAQPDECADLARERCSITLVGNHDLAVLGELDVSAFSSAAAEAARWTAENCEERTTEFIGALKPAGEREEIGLFHASPRDPVWEYVLSVDQAEDCMDIQERRIGLIGHSHVALFFARGGNLPNGAIGAGRNRESVRGAQAPDQARLDLSEGTWLVNPGSVGQPRDGDPRAAWLELEIEEAEAVYHRVEYDIDAAARPIVEAGLPKHLADRLFVGH
ncbi:MAG TPA: metallophosphoesterase family protein [Solirubrobacterales bacterium]|nr:metallophosphoesterase family protein [Solirubrobacterales bacterium]